MRFGPSTLTPEDSTLGEFSCVLGDLARGATSPVMASM